MTEADPGITPGAALNDPALRATVDRIRASRMPVRREEGERLRDLLARHPWQEFGYKRGAWYRAPGLFDQFWNYRTWQRDDDRLQVIDPATGTALAETTRTGFRALPGVQGRLWAAGDPRDVCVITPAGDGKEQLVLSAPVPSPVPYREEFRYGRSLWFADCPGKPRREDGYVWDPKAERRDWDRDRADAEQVRTEVNRALTDALRPSHWRRT